MDGHAWELALVRSLVALTLAAVALTQPAPEARPWLLAAYLLADGLIAVLAGLRLASRDSDGEGLLLNGLSGIAAGLAVFLGAGELLMQELAALLALWAIFSGVFLLQTAAQRCIQEPGRGCMSAAALASMLWGTALAVSPPAGTRALWWALAVYALTFGLLTAALAWRLRRAGQR